MGQPRRENPWQVTGISDGRREQEASASPVIKDGYVSVEVETKGRAVSLNDSEWLQDLLGGPPGCRHLDTRCLSLGQGPQL